MRKSKNYYKFMEYMAFGISGWHEDAVMVDNGVIECVAYPKVAHIEDYSKLYKCNYDKMTMDSENTWLTIKCVLVNEEVIDVYYVTNECNLYIGQLILDDYRTQKQALDAIHKKVVCFFLNSREFCELHPTEEINEYEETSETEEATRDTIETLPPHIYNDTDINPVCMKCQDENLLPYNCNDCSYAKNLRKTSFYGMFGGFPTITEMYNNKCFCCPADRQGNRCGGEQWCKETWKRYEAIINPEWHHVNLNTLANLDFDMLDEKRQLYLKLYRELKELIQDLHKCKSVSAYERRLDKMYIRNNELVVENKISQDYINYFTRKISMCNVECGLWTSRVEDATGLHKSRRYNRYILKY